MYMSRWIDVDDPDRERGQTFGPVRGGWYAANSARRSAAAAAGTLTIDLPIVATITPTIEFNGRIVYDQVNGIDEMPVCQRCGLLCADASEHLDTAAMIAFESESRAA